MHVWTSAKLLLCIPLKGYEDVEPIEESDVEKGSGYELPPGFYLFEKPPEESFGDLPVVVGFKWDGEGHEVQRVDLESAGIPINDPATAVVRALALLAIDRKEASS